MASSKDELISVEVSKYQCLVFSFFMRRSKMTRERIAGALVFFSENSCYEIGNKIKFKQLNDVNTQINRQN